MTCVKLCHGECANGHCLPRPWCTNPPFFYWTNPRPTSIRSHASIYEISSKNWQAMERPFLFPHIYCLKLRTLAIALVSCGMEGWPYPEPWMKFRGRKIERLISKFTYSNPTLTYEKSSPRSPAFRKSKK